MDAQHNGPTSLEALARRLEALERENAQLRGKVAALEDSDGRRRDDAANPRGSDPSEELEEGRISRRRLLGKAGAAAAGLVVAGALTQRDIREAKAADPFSNTTNTSGRGAVEGTNDNVDGYGVWGKGPSLQNSNSTGVLGESGYVGVKGKAPIGVQGVSDTGGVGVYGDDVSGSAEGEGVRGTSTQGRGVSGSSVSGYGGVFSGGKAQLRLFAGSTSGRPTGSHKKGEIYMDSNGALFVCVKSGSRATTPARWRKVSTTKV